MTREEAADVKGVSRNLAAFHLDKLVEVGLLRARYESPADQPRGRGRTPKVYRPTDGGLALTVPERRYELVAAVLADAVAQQPTRADQAAVELAEREGLRVGQQLTPREPTTTDAMMELAAAAAALDDLGFEPRPDHPAMLTLRNCPFHALADRQRQLICGLNHAFVAGLLTGIGAGHLAARLAPNPGACCVEVSVVDGGP